MEPLVVALVGNPNCGKTTLFNALTGGHQRVGNWAGVTVDQKQGQFKHAGVTLTLVDLPGCYAVDSSFESALDEKIATNYILSKKPSVIVNMVDASHLDRHLYLTLQLLEQDVPVIVVLNMMDLAKKQGLSIDAQALAERLHCPVVEMVALAKDPFVILKDTILKQACRHSVPAPTKLEQPKTAESRYAILREHLAAVTIRTRRTKPSVTTILDGFVLHQWMGLPLFFLLMYGVFWFTADVGGQVQDLLSNFLQILCVEKLAAALTLLHLPNWLIGVLSAGVGQGVQTTLSFIPVVASMFLCLAFLEGSGYMARAAFVMDRVMQCVGLSGKSFVPLILGFGCNVPAILAARTLENPRERILTILMIPFMSCGARLAIYALFVAAFFKNQGQNVIFCLYLVGIAVALLTGIALRKVLLKDEKTPFIMELPAYHLPNIRLLFRTTIQRVQRFVLKAGAIIIPLCVFIGLLGTLKTAHEDSWLMVIGKKMTPIFSPMGIEKQNWPATVGLLTGVLAKEVVVGTLSALYVEPGAEQAVLGAMAERFGSKEAAMAYLLFVLLYFPCVSVLATITRELNAYWALFSGFWTTGIAYGAAVLFYQVTQFNHHPLYSGLWIVGVVIGTASGFYGLKQWVSRTVTQKPKAFPTHIVLLGS